MRALVWKGFDKCWYYDVIVAASADDLWNPRGLRVVSMSDDFYSWREAYDAACAELRKRAKS